MRCWENTVIILPPSGWMQIEVLSSSCAVSSQLCDSRVIQSNTCTCRFYLSSPALHPRGDYPICRSLNRWPHLDFVGLSSLGSYMGAKPKGLTLRHCSA